MSEPGLSLHNRGENHGRAIIASESITTFLASMAVVLRLATRIWIVRNVGWDDYTILFAAFGKIIGSGIVFVEVHSGFGRHMVDLTHWQYIKFLKYSYGEWIQTFQTLMFTKVSICLLLIRIPVEKHLIRPIQGATVGLIVSNIILTLLWVFQCTPIARSWNKQTPGSCFTDGQLQRIIISQAIISIISDILLALFPIVLLWKVQIAPRIKAGLCTLMALGLFTAACCIVRTVLNWQNVNSDPTWKSAENWYWRAWEVCIGIIAACIPALRPGYRTVSAGISSYLSRRSARKNRDFALVNSSHPSHPLEDREATARHLLPPRASYDPAWRAAAQVVSIEADRVQEYGSGVDGFAMNSLPGGMRPVDRGIKKTTRIDVAGTSADGSQTSAELGDAERGLGNRDFL